MKFSGQEYSSGLPFPSPGDLPKGDWTWFSHIVGRLFTDWVTREDYPCLRSIISALSPVEEFGFLFWIQKFYSMDLDCFSNNSPIHNLWLNHTQLLTFFGKKKKKIFCCFFAFVHFMFIVRNAHFFLINIEHYSHIILFSSTPIL